MKKMLYFLTFTSGAIIGVIASWKYFENKYKKIADEEIESVMEVFSKEKETKSESEKEKPNDISAEEKETLNKTREEYVNMAIEYDSRIGTDEDAGYVEEQNITQLDAPSDDIQVISPDDFGEIEDYEKITLTYSADDVLTDDNDHIIYDIDNTVSEEALTTFGEYEDDAVHVVNHRLKCYYEILRDLDNYTPDL